MAGINKAILVNDYISGLSIPEVARKHCVSRSTVRCCVKNAGCLRSRAEGTRMAGKRGLLGSGLRGKKRVFTSEHIRNMSMSALNRGEQHAAGVSLKPNGYLEFTRGEHKGRSVHVVIAETQVIKRQLAKGEHVHHRDGNKANNSADNLEVLSISEHMRLHAKNNLTNRTRDENGRFR